MRKNKLGPPESLEVLAFKTMCVLVENVVRHKYGAPNRYHLVHYHYRHFFETKEQLMQEFGVPKHFAESLLPRLGSPYNDSRPLTQVEVTFIERKQKDFLYRPIEIHPVTRRVGYPLWFPVDEGLRICTRHSRGNFWHLYCLRCHQRWAPRHAWM